MKARLSSKELQPKQAESTRPRALNRRRAKQVGKSARSGATPPVGRELAASKITPSLPTEPSAAVRAGQSFRREFEKALGPQAVSQLVAGFTTRPVILIAGDQMTGKSTVAGIIAAELGDPAAASGTGAEFRRMAIEQGMTVEEFSAVAPPDLDVRLDYRAASVVGNGQALVFESRLAGYLGAFLRGLGRENLVSVFLECGPKERALRYLSRVAGPEARARIEPQLASLPADASLEDSLKAIGATNDPAAADLVARYDKIANRDDTDRHRLRLLYQVDYHDLSPYDVVLDTTGKTPEQVEEAILSAVRSRLSVHHAQPGELART